MKQIFKYDLQITIENDTSYSYPGGGTISGRIPCLLSVLKTLTRRIVKDIIKEIHEDPTCLNDPKIGKELSKLLNILEPNDKSP